MQIPEQKINLFIDFIIHRRILPHPKGLSRSKSEYAHGVAFSYGKPNTAHGVGTLEKTLQGESGEFGEVIPRK